MSNFEITISGRQKNFFLGWSVSALFQGNSSLNIYLTGLLEDL